VCTCGAQALAFLPSGSLVGAGFSYTPLLFTQQHGVGLYSNGKPLETDESGRRSDIVTSAVSAAMRMFQAQDKAGQEQSVNQSAKLSSIHQNCVTCVRTFDANVSGRAIEFTTTGLDGLLVFWTSDELSSAMRALPVSK
jgi:hypothetical protein